MGWGLFHCDDSTIGGKDAVGENPVLPLNLGDWEGPAMLVFIWK